jgi:hypothetical protein
VRCYLVGGEVGGIGDPRPLLSDAWRALTDLFELINTDGSPGDQRDLRRHRKFYASSRHFRTGSGKHGVSSLDGAS